MSSIINVRFLQADPDLQGTLVDLVSTVVTVHYNCSAGCHLQAGSGL